MTAFEAPFDGAPFDYTPFEFPQGLRQDLRQGRQGIRLTALIRMRSLSLCERASPKKDSSEPHPGLIFEGSCPLVPKLI